MREKTYYQKVDDDYRVLCILHDDLEKLLKKFQDLQNQPQGCDPYKILGVLYPAIVLITFFGLSIWLFTSSKLKFIEADKMKKLDMNHTKKWETVDNQGIDYMIAGCLMLLIAVFGGFSSIVQGKNLYSTGPRVLSKEWEPIIDQLHNILINRLQENKNFLSQEMNDYCLTLEEDIRSLKQKQDCNPLPGKSISDVIGLLDHLMGNVENIRKKVYHCNISVNRNIFLNLKIPPLISFFKSSSQIEENEPIKNVYIPLNGNANNLEDSSDSDDDIVLPSIRYDSEEEDNKNERSLIVKVRH